MLSFPFQYLRAKLPSPLLAPSLRAKSRGNPSKFLSSSPRDCQFPGSSGCHSDAVGRWFWALTTDSVITDTSAKIRSAIGRWDTRAGTGPGATGVGGPDAQGWNGSVGISPVPRRWSHGRLHQTISCWKVRTNFRKPASKYMNGSITQSAFAVF